MFDHSSSAYHPLIFDDNPNNEHISSFDCDLNSAEPIQVPIPTVSGDSLRVLFGDPPSGRSDGRLLTPFEEALSFSGQQGRLSRLSSPTSRSSHHTHLSNHKDDAGFSVDVDVESDNSDSESDSSESVELTMSSTTTMTLSSAQHSTEFVYSGAGSVGGVKKKLCGIELMPISPQSIGTMVTTPSPVPGAVDSFASGNELQHQYNQYQNSPTSVSEGATSERRGGSEAFQPQLRVKEGFRRPIKRMQG
ncbi:hypothetical protein F5877DRAFT_72963 [Lentinula edodes]|nr:hypothetical protein F5877DRAFT_72963 [Lentinula edodes]